MMTAPVQRVFSAHVHGLVGERGSPYVGNNNRTASGPYYWCSTERLRCGAVRVASHGRRDQWFLPAVSHPPDPTTKNRHRFMPPYMRALQHTAPSRVSHGPGSCTKHVGHFRLFSHFIFPWMPACRAMKATAFQLHPRISPSTAAFFLKKFPPPIFFFLPLSEAASVPCFHLCLQ